MKVHVTDSQIRSWRIRGFTLEHMARACGTTISSISHRIQRIWQDEQQRMEMWGDPGPEEIRQACDEIQRGWSAKERLKREVGRERSWKPVVVPASLLGLVRD